MISVHWNSKNPSGHPRWG